MTTHADTERVNGATILPIVVGGVIVILTYICPSQRDVVKYSDLYIQPIVLWNI